METTSCLCQNGPKTLPGFKYLQRERERERETERQRDRDRERDREIFM